MATLAKAPRTTYEGNIVSSVSYETLLSVLSNPLMDGALFLLDIEKQIQQLQAQRSNLPKVDIGEKVSMNSLAISITYIRFPLYLTTLFLN